MKLKKTAILLLVIAMIASLSVMTACSKDTKNLKDSETTKKADTSAVEEPEDVTDSEASSESEDAIDENVDESVDKGDGDTEVDEAQTEGNDEPSPDENTDAPTSTESTEPVIYEEVPESVIENARFEFKYFEEWEENVRFETKESADRYEIACYGVGLIDGFHCFSIVFADCDGMADHYYMGDLNSTPVYTYVNQNFSALNEEQITLINDTVLSYYMNDLTYQLKDAEGFVTSR